MTSVLLTSPVPIPPPSITQSAATLNTAWTPYNSRWHETPLNKSFQHYYWSRQDLSNTSFKPFPWSGRDTLNSPPMPYNWSSGRASLSLNTPPMPYNWNGGRASLSLNTPFTPYNWSGHETLLNTPFMPYNMSGQGNLNTPFVPPHTHTWKSPEVLNKFFVLYSNWSGQQGLRSPQGRTGWGGEGLWYLHPQWRTMPPLPPWLLLLIGVVMSVVGVTGAIGNIILILLLLRCTKLRSSANLYVFNMATADLLMCLGNFPLLVTSAFNGKWVSGFSGCKIYAFIGAVAGFLSINSLTAMACDRYNVISRNKTHHTPTSRQQSIGLTVSLWIYSFFWAVPPFIGWGHFALDGGQISCCFDYLTRSPSDISYIMAIFVFCFGIQVVILIFCYTSIARAIRQYQRHLQRGNNLPITLGNKRHLHYHTPNQHHYQQPPGGEDEIVDLAEDTDVHVLKTSEWRKGRRRILEVRVTRQVVLITLSFCLSWTPFAVVSLIGVFGEASLVTPLVSVLPGIVAKTATVINPVLFAMGHPQYRSILVQYLRRICGQPGNSQKRRVRHGQITGHMLSSVYFATVLRQSVHSDPLGEKDTGPQTNNSFGNVSCV